MKKIIALVLAIIMMASMSVVAFAAEESIATADPVELNDTDNSDKTADTLVEYKPTLGYEVIIPGDLELVENETETADGTTYYGKGEGPVAINKAKIPAGKKIELLVASKTNTEGNNEHNWKLTGSDAKSTGLVIYYDITLGNLGQNTTASAGALDQGDVVLSYTSGKGFKAQTGTLTFETEKIIQAGNFADTLTFTAQIVPAA